MKPSPQLKKMDMSADEFHDIYVHKLYAYAAGIVSALIGFAGGILYSSHLP